MSSPGGLDPAAQAAAAAAAARAMTIEMFTLYAVGVMITILRTYARVSGVGFRNLRADDYLIWAAMGFYTAQTTLGYSIGAVAHGLANNGMTDEQRATLSPDSEEWALRVIGSKIQVAGWSCYSNLIFLLKMCMLIFYIRLVEGLDNRYRVRIWIGFGLVIATWVASILTILTECLPFEKNWQINPDPGNVCQASVSLPIIWATFSSNIVTDIYLILIPLPLLWTSSLRLAQKTASSVVLGAGIFVLVAATLKSIFVLTDPDEGGQLAGQWGTRETFVATVTTNLPMIFPLFKIWLTPLFGSMLRSARREYKTPTGFRTIGGGGGDDNTNNRRNRGDGDHSSSMGNQLTGSALTFTESEERMMNDVKLHALAGGYRPDDAKPAGGIIVSNEVEVTSEDRQSQHGGDNMTRAQRVHEHW